VVIKRAKKKSRERLISPFPEKFAEHFFANPAKRTKRVLFGREKASTPPSPAGQGGNARAGQKAETSKHNSPYPLYFELSAQ